MSKQITKIELDGNSLGTKPLITSDTLTSIREKIKERVNVPYIFLDKNGQPINREKENDFSLESISENKMIRIKAENNTSTSKINLILNDTNTCSIDCSLSQNLEELRNIINQNIKDEFSFLDKEGFPITKEDEKLYSIEDILNGESIKIKGNDSPAATPLYETNPNKNTNIEKLKDIKKNKPKTNYDFSKYEIVEKRDDLITYRYSKEKGVSSQKLVFQYFFDDYNPEDYNKAYVILFCGKTGDGKTTAINAFFNIIKGVTIKDNYRFILISEPQKKKGQAESQTDGVHLYYIKDYENKPVIIIDSQGYGDTRGKAYDEMVDEAFRYVFSSVIDHINAAFFIVKSNTNRLDILTKYIFSSVTSLFSEDISENFIIIATFANKSTINKGPDFVESIQTDADFLNINKRMDNKWWYAIDSRSIMDNEEDKLTLYSFEKAVELYEEKVKKLRPKGIKKCADVLNTRMELRIEVEHLNDTFQDLLVEQDNLQLKENELNDTSQKIILLEKEIRDLENDKGKLDQKQLDEKMKHVNDGINDILMKNQTESKQIKKLKYYADSKCTHCDSCEKNCHETCDCHFAFLGRCKIFTFWTKRCEECGCHKDSHKQDNYYYTYETVTIAKDIDAAKQKEIEEQKKKMLDEMNKDNNAKTNLQKHQNELLYNKTLLENQKENNLHEKADIQKKIIDINNQILFIIIKLQSISEKINDIAMNNNHLKNEEEYIDDLMDKMDKINNKEQDKIAKIKKIKESNNIFKNAVKMDRNELMKLNDSQLAEKLKIIIPTHKKKKKNK